MTTAANDTDRDPDRETLACRTCGQPHRLPALPDGAIAECVRCGAEIARNPNSGLSRTAALSLAALLLYVPANVFPILSIQQNGARSESTVMGSVRLLWNGGDFLIALIVFAASVVIPPVKLVALLYLSASTMLNSTRGRRFRTFVFRTIEAIGKWAMLDVFVLAVLVAVVKLRGLVSVHAELGVLPFAIVVLLTLFATSSFDPRLIWKHGTRET